MTQEEYKILLSCKRRIRTMKERGKIHAGRAWRNEEYELLMVSLQFWPNTVWRNYEAGYFLRHS